MKHGAKATCATVASTAANVMNSSHRPETDTESRPRQRSSVDGPGQPAESCGSEGQKVRVAVMISHCSLRAWTEVAEFVVQGCGPHEPVSQRNDETVQYPVFTGEQLRRRAGFVAGE